MSKTSQRKRSLFDLGRQDAARLEQPRYSKHMNGISVYMAGWYAGKRRASYKLKTFSDAAAHVDSFSGAVARTMQALFGKRAE